MSTTTHPPVAAGDIEQLKSALVAALGADAVTDDAEALLEFRDPYWVRGSADFDASLAVAPTTTEQVQQVVRLANEHGVPLWTIGQGRNNTYGGAAPRVRGSVIVNLREMNRVLEVNEDLCYAVVQPGVRFFDLYDALLEAGGHCWASIPDLGWGSVVGNTLEYGRGYTPYGDHPANVCGMEVVLPDGEVLRTGMGGQTDNPVWHAYQYSFGPSLDRLFMQSNFGIVTSMGVWLMPAPEVLLACGATWEGEEALEAMAEALRELMLEGVIRNYPLMGRGLNMGIDGAPAIDPSDSTWRMRFALYGRRERVDLDWSIVERTLRAIPGVELQRREFGRDREGVTDHNDSVHAGLPDMQLMDLFKTPYGEDTGHLDFSVVGPLTGQDVAETFRLVRDLYERNGHSYLGGLLISPRNVLHITSMFFDPNDEEQTRAVYAAYEDMVIELGKHNKIPYRTNIHHMDLVAEQLDFNDHIQMRTNERIKDALDPNGILSPGKQGIWPARTRAAAGG